jgi:ABC-type antimicrobial peptide transport system permease subunit
VYNMSWMFAGSQLTPPSWYHSDEWDMDLSV